MPDRQWEQFTKEWKDKQTLRKMGKGYRDIDRNDKRKVMPQNWFLDINVKKLLDVKKILFLAILKNVTFTEHYRNIVT